MSHVYNVSFPFFGNTRNLYKVSLLIVNLGLIYGCLFMLMSYDVIEQIDLTQKENPMRMVCY